MAPADPSAVGGWSGLVLSSIPPVLLVAVDRLVGLQPALIVASTFAVVVCVARIRRGDPVGQAAGGMIGVAVSAVIAWRTGSAAGYFLADIFFSLTAGILLLLSIVVRRPLVGVLWQVARREPVTRLPGHRFDLATGAWLAVFAARFGVQSSLYAEQQVAWMAVAKIVLGLPLTAAATLVTIWAVTRPRAENVTPLREDAVIPNEGDHR